MSLNEQVQQDFIAAMKAREELKKTTLSMLKAAIMKWEVDGEKKEATDEVVTQIIQREVKARRDAAEGFKTGGKMDMAEKEEMEMKILMEYLPAQMSEEEVRAVITETLGAAGITAKSEMGKAMGLVMGKLKGKADGGLINKVVGELLK
ncbi:GatB/YqeY domain-containing protein [Candidatus Peregrinibacteria bacterium]|nr:GatB/YqeY domain-containing protein [Candidatus Peregrinibacteria bacterium]